ncbi:MAG: hypothetical protein SFW64_00560 [Alphaproteobacteria bacterium]|nr:hypothetical protein [Alphaproteobacteria bacterium]
MVHFVLERAMKALSDKGLISSARVSAQKQYVSEIASDIWDHIATGVQKNGKPFQLWCQTTCYKGNGTGAPEPNKTYEVRETLVEGITIRDLVNLQNENEVRTLHFTVGDSDYTYKWFLGLKSASYDKSLYVGKKGLDVFELLDAALRGAITESAKATLLEKCIVEKSELGNLILNAANELFAWFVEGGMPKSNIADLQWQLVNTEHKSHAGKWPDFSKLKGEDIKGRTNRFLFDADIVESDTLIPRAAAKILERKPFLSAALKAVADWPTFETEVQRIYERSGSIEDFVRRLWNAPSPLHLLTRRILLRIHTGDSIAYVQDRDVAGISEHNLYAGSHSEKQVRLICNRIVDDISKGGITTSLMLMNSISTQGKRIVNQARWFEAKNGTELKPSFEYAEMALQSAGFKVLSPAAAKFKANGYHGEITVDNVRPYTNLKAVCNADGKILAILKAKFFRIQEFPRRCKEESFVGLTLKYKFENGAFVPRHNIPVVMFVDMAVDCKPPEYAVKRLISFGWDVVFSTDELISLMHKIDQGS